MKNLSIRKAIALLVCVGAMLPAVSSCSDKKEVEKLKKEIEELEEENDELKEKLEKYEGNVTEETDASKETEASKETVASDSDAEPSETEASAVFQ